MSRDWTPREQLAAEKILDGKKWLDVSRGMVISYNGTEKPMCPADYCDFLEQFKYLSSVGYDAVFPLYKKYGSECVDVVTEIEKHLSSYIEHETITEQWVSDWFDGKLDEGFYYSTRNNELFLEKAEELKAKLTKDTTPKMYEWYDIVMVKKDNRTIYAAESFPISGEMDTPFHYQIDEFIEAVEKKYGVDEVKTYMMGEIKACKIPDEIYEKFPFGICDCGCHINGVAEWLIDEPEQTAAPLSRGKSR